MNSKQTTGTETNVQEQDDNQAKTLNSIDGLKPAQRRAIERLAAGGRVGDVAREAGVHRNTIRRWLGEPAFLRELQCVDGQMRQVARSRVFAMADSAANSIEYAIAKGDARLALQLLKSIDVFGYDRIRSNDASQRDLDLLTRFDAQEAGPEDAGTDEIGEQDRTGGFDRINRMDGISDSEGAIERENSGVWMEPEGVDEATDDPHRYNSPILGNFGRENRGEQRATDETLFTCEATAPIGACSDQESLPSAVPSLGFALQCIAAWFSMHCFALSCTMRAFFACFLAFKPVAATVSGVTPGAGSTVIGATTRREPMQERGESATHPLMSLLTQIGLFRQDKSSGISKKLPNSANCVIEYGFAR